MAIRIGGEEGALPFVMPQKDIALIFKILKRHGIAYEGKEHLLTISPTRKRWTQKEKEDAYEDWVGGLSTFDLVCKYNRNPKDLGQALREVCKTKGVKFKHTRCARIDNKANWNKECAEELFKAGLPLWKVAIALDCEMTYVQRHLINRGHEKKINQVSTEHKWFVNRQVLRNTHEKVSRALDAYGGLGHSAEIIHEVFPQAHIDVVEIDKETYEAGKERCPTASWHLGDNLEFLEGCESKYDFVDLDPFSNSYEQLKMIWGLLKSRGVFFLTLGGEYLNAPLYRNRVSIKGRYDFDPKDIEFKPYQDAFPYYFLGWVLKQANDHGFLLNVTRSVRYMSICRFWLTFERVEKARPQYTHDGKGYYPNFKITIPRFKDVRGEMNTPMRQSELF